MKQTFKFLTSLIGHSMSATCLPPVLIGTSLELHRNFIGTSSRHYAVFSHLASRFANSAACGNNKRLCRSTMGFASRKVAMSLLLLALSFGFSSQAWAWWYVPGTIPCTDSWQTNETCQMNSSNTITFYGVPAGSYDFKLAKDENNNKTWGFGSLTNNSSSIITTLTVGQDNPATNNKISITKTADLTFSITDEGQWKCTVTATESPYYIKYSWNGSTTWNWSNALTSEGDGKYSCIGQYGNTQTYNYNRKNDDCNCGYNATATIIGEPSTGDQCVFTFNSSDNSLTIRKCSYVAATSHVYFDNSSANWNDSYIQFVIGRPATTGDEYSGQYKFSSITNTKLLYVAIGDNWNDVAYYAIMGTSSAYNGTKWYIPNVYNADHYSAAYTNKYDLQQDMVTLVKKDNATNKGAISLDYISGGYTDFNKTQTVKVMVKKAGASNYTEETTFANWPGSIKAKRYTLNSNGASSANETDADLESSATFTSVITSEATLTATAAAGYVFKGWGESSTSSPSGTSSKTYTVSDETTTYAFFEETTYQVNYGVHESNHGELTAKANDNAFNSGDNVKASVNVVFTATPATGYHVEGWYDNSDCSTGKIDAAGIDDTYTINSLDAAANVYVKFAANTYSVKFNDNESTSGSMSNQAFTYDDAAKALTSNAFAKTGYTFQGWDTDQSADDVVHEDGKYVSNLTTTNGDVVNLYAVWQEKMNNNISVASNSTDKGTVNINTATFGISTGQEITATPKDGYYVESWTLPDHAVIASGEGTNTITVKASGDEEVFGTIIANFAERWRLVGSLDETSNPTGGMPGWNQSEAQSLTLTDGKFTTTVTLEPNKRYKYRIYDRADDNNLGCTDQQGTWNQPAYSEEEPNICTLEGYCDVHFYSAGHGDYTFCMHNIEDLSKPQICIKHPTSYQLTMGTKTTTAGSASLSDEDGGALSAKDNENYSYTSGQYIIENGTITFTAAPNSGYSFDGFYWNAECTDANKYTNKEHIELGQDGEGHPTLTISNIGMSSTVYAKFTENLTTVTITKTGNGTIDTESVQVGVASSAQITVTPDANYYYAGWTNTDDVNPGTYNEDNTTITIYGNGAGAANQTLTINFVELDKVYFKNVIPETWTNNSVYVYFWVRWGKESSEYDGVIPNKDKTYLMTQIAGTDIYWAYVPRDVVQSNDMKMAFSDVDMSDNTEFYGNLGVYRTDWNRVINMYVPSFDKNSNSTNYYSKGYWMSYNPQINQTVGYKLYQGAADKGDFLSMGDGKSYVDVRIDALGEITNFCVTSIGDTHYATGTKYTSTTTNGDLSLYDSEWDISVTPSCEGTYRFILTQGNEKMQLTIEYPVGVGDYRVAWINGDNKRYSDVIKSSDAANINTLSMYLIPNEGNLKLQKCTDITDGVPQWSEGTDIAWTDFINDQDQGVYQFDITITTDNAALTNVDLYTGNYYIKTDGVKGGWGNYKENIMDENTSTFSKEDASTYDRYYCQWISNEGKNYNVKCVIANDYCNALSDTLRGDAYVKENASHEPYLPKPANVRFSYNTYTNTLKRDYISGSTDDADRFLMLIGNDKMFGTDEQPLVNNELKFIDKNNWVYQADIKAQPGCAVKLTADYDNQTQYFIGAESGDGATKTIISSTEESSTKYTMRAVYDFKTNLLVAGWVPDGTEITDNIELGGDMLITREHQKEAKQITFGVKEESGTSGSISDIHHVYGVLTLQKDTMLGKGTGSAKYTRAVDNTSYDRCLYWISFPFDVKVSEIFGVDGYGTKWILQKYNGQRRADIGWFAETPTFWEYMSKSETMNAYEGYVLCLDPTYFDEESDDVWANNATEANFYFPSANGTIGIVHADNYTQPVPAHECKIERTFTVDDKELSHTITDSHWNVIGVPAFQNASASTISPTNENFKSFYEWDPTNNSYKPKITLGMKLGDDEKEVEGYVFKTMHAYMVQFYGSIEWSNVSMVKKETLGSVAPRRLEETAHYMAEIEFHQGAKASDHTYINLADNATTDFLLNEDMMKIDNAGCPNIYSFAGNYNVAYNETSKASQIVDLGVSAPAAGNYKFHMPSDFTGTVTLIDNVEQTRTNLQVQDYELYLDKGTYNDRFQLEINLQSVVTNLDNVFGGQVTGDHAVKFIRDDKLFILRSGSIFDATGKRMK